MSPMTGRTSNSNGCCGWVRRLYAISVTETIPPINSSVNFGSGKSQRPRRDHVGPMIERRTCAEVGGHARDDGFHGFDVRQCTSGD